MMFRMLRDYRPRSLKYFLLLSVFFFSSVVLSTPACASTTNAASPGKYDPVADPRAIVVVGHARFTVLTPQMIRLEWAADGKFEDRPSFVFLQRRLPVPEFQQTRLPDGGVEIKTRDCDLRYQPNGDGKFTAEDLTITFMLEGKTVTWHPGLADTGNLGGTTRTLDGALGSKTHEPIGPGLVSRDGWTVVDDSERPLFDSDDFSFTQGEKSQWPWVVERSPGDRQDWYFFGYGHDYKQALGDFIKVAGRIPLPPRFAFGAWWSRYWAYSDQELDQLVAGFHENNVPLDVFVIDMEWHKTFPGERKLDQSGHTLGWSGYSWNPLLFPDPGAFLTGLHDQGLKVTLNLHPASGVQPFEDAYPAMARAMGQDPAAQKYVPFDITNKKFAKNYFEILHHPLERQGIDFWWLDWQQEGNTQMAGVNPTWWLNYTHFTDQAMEGKRPLLFHRWGGLGNHRYQIGFSGDTISVWESLAFQPGFTAQAANVGYAYWSHDIGGHMPGAVDAELYTRWLQFGAFSPILRTHTTKNPESERRIWAYPEPYSGIMRNIFQLRYAMQPYIYTEARHTYDTGVAFLRPLYYDWPNADEAYNNKQEYIFGSNMIVAPVTQSVDSVKQTAAQTLWLPPGGWFEWPTGKHLTGPATVTNNFSISQIPVYLRDGAILPMQPPMRYTGEKPVDPLILTVFPLNGAKDSSYTVYEDGSDGRKYQTGEFTNTAIRADERGGDLVLHVEAAKGSYPGMLKERALELRLPGDWPPEFVLVNGHPVSYTRRAGMPGWHFEGNTLSTIIRTERLSTAKPVEILVHRSAALIARRAELDGYAGAMTRLRECYDTVNQTWPIAWSPDALIDAMQSGDRLGYHPDRAATELKHFHEILPQAVTEVDKAAEPPSDDRVNAIARRMNIDPKSEAVKKRLADILALQTRARAQMQEAAAEVGAMK
jgi:alpha-glucosidase (family GH31 glycosyl hydrolase)